MSISVLSPLCLTAPMTFHQQAEITPCDFYLTCTLQSNGDVFYMHFYSLPWLYVMFLSFLHMLLSLNNFLVLKMRDYYLKLSDHYQNSVVNCNNWRYSLIYDLLWTRWLQGSKWLLGHRSHVYLITLPFKWQAKEAARSYHPQIPVVSLKRKKSN
jgi:hypothetical protein